MAISHVCMGCGQDLARVRAGIEPHYHLPLVVCPRCGAAEVRREHPLWAAWKRCRGAAGALTALVLQVLLLTGLTASTTATVVSFGGALRSSRWDILRAIELSAMSGGGATLPVIVGCWLTIGLSHRSAGRVWVAWWLWIAAWLAWRTGTDAWRSAAAGGGEMPVWHRVAATLALAWRAGLADMAALVAVTLLSLLGVPLGRAARRALAARRSRRWLALRRRLRHGRAIL